MHHDTGCRYFLQCGSKSGNKLRGQLLNEAHSVAEQDFQVSIKTDLQAREQQMSLNKVWKVGWSHGKGNNIRR
jgi:hypothetical protein